MEDWDGLMYRLEIDLFPISAILAIIIGRLRLNPTHKSAISSGLNWSTLHSVFARDWLEAFLATGRGRVSGDDPLGAPYWERAINR
jgi:hypothetical protein